MANIGLLKQVALLNTSILTSFGSFNYEPTTVDEARNAVAANGFTSHIGHDATAAVMSTLLDVDVPMSRAPYAQNVGDVALVLKMRGRIPEGKIITDVDELNAIGYDLGWLTRTA